MALLRFLQISAMFLVQTLLLREGRVLLGRWRRGPFAQRLTGLLGSAAGPSVEAAAAAVCRPYVELEPRRLRLRGIFRFQDIYFISHSHMKYSVTSSIRNNYII